MTPLQILKLHTLLITFLQCTHQVLANSTLLDKFLSTTKDSPWTLTTEYGSTTWAPEYRKELTYGEQLANIHHLTDIGPEAWPPIIPGDPRQPIYLGLITAAKALDYYSAPYTDVLGRYNNGALTIAIEEINNSSDILPNHTMHFYVGETLGIDVLSLFQTSNLISQLNVSAILGPPHTCIYEAKIAALFRTFILSHYCSEAALSNKDEYPTFARVRSTNYDVGEAAALLLKEHNWKQVVIIRNLVQLFDMDWTDLTNAVISALAENGISVVEDTILNPSQLFNSWGYSVAFEKIINKTRNKARIYVIVGDARDSVAFCHALGNLGYTESGEYFVLGIDMSNPFNPEFPDFMTRPHWDDLPFNELHHPTSLDLHMRNMAVIMRSQFLNPKFKEFNSRVQDYCQRPPFNYPHRSDGVNDVILAQGANLYDATHVLARALEATINDGADYRDGHELFKRTINQTFLSKTGHNVTIDELGNAAESYSIYQAFPLENGTLHPRDHPIHTKEDQGLKLVGSFDMSDPANPVIHYLPEYGGLVLRNPPVLDEPRCGYDGSQCAQTDLVQLLKTLIPPVILAVIILIFIPVVVIKWRCMKQRGDNSLLDLILVNYCDIKMNQHKAPPLMNRVRKVLSRSLQRLSLAIGADDLDKVSHTMMTSNVQPQNNVMSSWSSLVSINQELQGQHTRVGTYKGQIVAIKKIRKTYADTSSPEIRRELKQMKDMRCDNLTAFIGVCVEPGNILILTEYCSKGNLQDVLQNSEVKLDNIFTHSLIFDLIRGMLFLHDSEIQFHGHLRSTNCVIDSRFTLKLTGYGLRHFKEGETAPDDTKDVISTMYKLWQAPEILRLAEKDKLSALDYQKADVYAFAIILYEICGRMGPFGDWHMSYDATEILDKIKEGGELPFRPKVGDLALPQFFIDTIKECWAEVPEERPTFKQIKARLKPLQKGKKGNIFETLLIPMLEDYATQLETIVVDRTQQLMDEKAKTDALLYEMLPRSVAEQLKRGKEVEAEAFENVTIYFSDIVGFTNIASDSSPIQVVKLLNALYTLLDSIITEYDVYKVETIGDAYMVASGVPRRNGINHAGEIASMSLHLLKALKNFKIPHKPTETMQLRIGLNSGPCVAGVVGLKMPRYCLFGDTVNTASRMESHGSPLKIHTSASTKELLDKLGGYKLSERGIIEMKGKGSHLTYWLDGEDKTVREHRLQHSAQSIHLGWNVSRLSNKTSMYSTQTKPVSLKNKESTGNKEFFVLEDALPDIPESRSSSYHHPTLYESATIPAGNTSTVVAQSVQTDLPDVMDDITRFSQKTETATLNPVAVSPDEVNDEQIELLSTNQNNSERTELFFSPLTVTNKHKIGCSHSSKLCDSNTDVLIPLIDRNFNKL